MSRFARGGIVPGGTSGDDRVPALLDNSYVVPASMLRTVDFALDDDEAELERVPTRPSTEADEAEDVW